MDGTPCTRCGQPVSGDQTLFSAAGERICGACNDIELAVAQEARGRESAARERPRSLEAALFQGFARGAVQAGATRQGQWVSAFLGVGLVLMGGLGLLYVAGGFGWLRQMSTAHGRCTSDCVEPWQECARKCDWRTKDACIAASCNKTRKACEEACPP